jgi:hypothetical protein
MKRIAKNIFLLCLGFLAITLVANYLFHFVYYAIDGTMYKLLSWTWLVILAITFVSSGLFWRVVEK